MDVILTPAAGNDWVAPDPKGRVELLHGSFRGPILAESLLQTILFMNQQMPQMLTNFENHSWNTNIQTESRLRNQQNVLIIGFGNVGSDCAAQIRGLGSRVIAIRKSTGPHSPRDTVVFGIEQLSQFLLQADRIVLLLPGN